MAAIYPVCALCETVPEKGLYDGIYLGQGFICSRCEKNLVKASPENDDYENYINGIKKLKLYP